MSERISRIDFQSRRGQQVSVSTIVMPEPTSFGIAAAPGLSYEAETVVFVDGRVSGLLRYFSRSSAERRHPAVVKRALRGAS